MMKKPEEYLAAIGVIGFLIYTNSPWMRSFFDVKEGMLAPDVSIEHITKIKKRLERADGEIFSRFLARRMPDENLIGDWGNEMTVSRALTEERVFEKEAQHQDAEIELAGRTLAVSFPGGHFLKIITVSQRLKRAF